VAKSSVSGGSPAEPLHTRTTTGPEDSTVVVVGQDGTDNVAALIQRGALPGAGDYGLAVVPLNTPRPAYQVVTASITSGTATGIARPLQLWHPSTLAKDAFIIEIGANFRTVHTAGNYDFELQFITAESATGSALTPQPLDRALSASGLSVRSLPTAETATGALIQRASQAPTTSTQPNGVNYDGVVLFRAKDLDDYSDAIKLRSSVAEGLLVRQNILSTLTTAPVFNVYARYIERA
jgi:hypothetical protein